MWRIRLPISFLLLVSVQISAQLNLFSDPATLEFSKITQKDGLSHNNIECIFKDSDGFMWFGTRNGLCRFDGYEINIFRNSSDSNSLSGDRIMAIEEDLQGNLWIGTFANGLNKYSKKFGVFSNFNHIPALSERINRIKVFKDGSVWICSSNGLIKIDPDNDSLRIFNHVAHNPNSLLANTVYDILEASDGKIYVAPNARLIQQFDPEREQFISIEYKRHPDLDDDYRKRIIEDHKGTLWIAASIHGLSSLNPTTGESKIFMEGKNQLSTKILTGDMAIDNAGRLWICTDGGGVNIFDPETEKFEYIRKQNDSRNSLSTDHIYTLYFDDQNILWVGTFAEGINYYNPARYKFNSVLDTVYDFSILKNKSVISLFQDSKARLWAGTDGDGLFRFEPDGKHHIYTHNPDKPNSLSTNVITSINEDNWGNLLIGTYSGGLHLFDLIRNKFILFDDDLQQEKSPSSSSIWCMLHDSNDRIWLGLLGTAVDLYNQTEGIFTNFGPSSTHTNKINFTNVMTMMEDTDGDIWFGTEGDGIYILDAETNRIFRMEATDSENLTTQGIITCIYQDRWGKIWIGTEGQGFFQLDKKTHAIKKYTVEDGLINNIVQSIIEDGQGNFWLGTSGGLSKFNSLNSTFHNFIEQDGLSGEEFNQNTLIRLHDGRLVIGSSKGLDIFNPEDIKLNQNLPRVVFTRFEIMNQVVIPGKEINGRIILRQNINYTTELTLTHREKIFSLEFAALNYTLPQKCRYLYQLEGFDEGWNKTSSKYRRVSYSNLKAGEYILKVKASNNDGKWGNNESTIFIRVLPPFYETFWFRAIIILSILLVVYFIYRYRLNIHRSQFLKKQTEQDKKILNLEKEKIESELQKMTFHMINRNRVLIDQKNRLMGLSMKAKESVKIGLQDIISIIDEDLSDDKDWVHIEPQLDKVYNNFVSHLKEKHPDLTLSEIKIAAYVRMNLSTKEISEFMHKTSRAVENDRYRLRKKIGLDSNDSLQQYLMNI